MSSRWDSVRKSSEKYFIEVQRINAHERIMLKIVAPHMFEEFISYVLDNCKISLKYKMMICLELCSGSRISELLEIRKKDIIYKNGAVAIMIAVKKKRREKSKMLHRMGAVPPRIVPALEKYIAPLSPDEKIFKVGRRGVWRMYKAMFDICPHSLRHSFITYCFDIKNMNLQQIVNKMVFASSEACLRYYNARIDRDAWDLFKDVA